MFIAENIPVRELPPSMMAKVQACNAQGIPLLSGGQPLMQDYPIVPPGGMLYRLRFTNQTGHVVRLHGAVMRLFDPAGNQWEPMGKPDIQAVLQAERPCLSTQQLAARIQTTKFLDTSAELLPNIATDGWLYFKPSSLNIPGVWKLALYEVAVETDAAGRPTKKATFEWAIEVTKYEDTYAQEFMGSPKLVSSKPLQ